MAAALAGQAAAAPLGLSGVSEGGAAASAAAGAAALAAGTAGAAPGGGGGYALERHYDAVHGTNHNGTSDGRANSNGSGVPAGGGSGGGRDSASGGGGGGGGGNAAMYQAGAYTRPLLSST